MKFQRLFTTPIPAIQDQIKWKTLPSEILDSTGGRIFYMPEVEVPDHWTQGPTNILAQKYFRKAGVPNFTIMAGGKDFESTLPTWLVPHIPDDTNLDFKLGSEISARQVFHRLAGAWTYWGWKEGIFKQGDMIAAEDYQSADHYARVFYDEIYYMLAMQFAAPNSPQWFNTGLNWAYGITGNANGQWAVNDKGEVFESPDSYTYSQPHACFIQPVTDSLVTPGGIMDLWSKEARLFKQGSGTGTNFSSIRGKGEPLSGGGKSSGLMSFLKIGDVVAGSIASGGTTRRAAKMVCLDLDHPEIEEFIDWKMKEEAKAAALYVGSQILNDEFHGKNGLLGGKEYIPTAMIDRFSNDIEPEICDLDFEGKAMSTVDGQNANNSIRITNEFLRKVDNWNNWPLIARTTGKIVKVIHSKELWQKICRAAWACADPGLQFHDTINLWHTCKNDGEINASNPCSEYMFLDDTACNLASLNLGKFLIKKDHQSHNQILYEFDIKSFTHATRLWTTVLEISVYMASFPSKEIARNSYLYRTLGLGYANIGGILMRLGLGYDSDQGRNWAANITAIMHGISLITSAEMAGDLGEFEKWEINNKSMSDVIELHRKAAMSLSKQNDLGKEVHKIWYGIQGMKYRNAQTTLIAPTGTIALLMDCDTTGIEPDFSLVKYKHLSGGGMMKIVNECVPEALKTLGYTPAQIMSITQHITDNDTIEGWTVNGQPIPEEHLKIFDCAVPGGNGTRSLPPIAHVKMVAAVQPFLSGAVSKTVNIPNSATIADVDHIYRQAHRLGLKAIAIYRDGSKLTQPLNTGQKPKFNKTITPNDLERTAELAEKFGWETEPERSEGRGPVTFDDLLNKTPDTRPHIQRGNRHRLPPRTTGYRQKYSIDGQSIYLHTGEYLDGRLGEIFVEFSREGSLVRALSNSIGKVVSIGLQYGVPLNEFVDAFVFTKFEPSGIVHGHDRIKLCTSPLDLIFKDLAIHYLGMEEFANTTPNGLDEITHTTTTKEELEKALDINLSPERSEGRGPENGPINIGKEFDELNIEFIKATLNVEGLGSSFGNTVTTSGIETFPVPESIIGGTHLCEHRKMALICPICTPGEGRVPEPESHHNMIQQELEDTANFNLLLNSTEDIIAEITERANKTPSPDPNPIITHTFYLGFEQMIERVEEGIVYIKPLPIAPDPDPIITQDSRILSGARESAPIPVFAQALTNPQPIPTIRLKHGDACQLCGHYPTLRTGTCITCPNCGANSGCG